jgi:PadR family transcriptional regulator, regulatory protein AphA
VPRSGLTASSYVVLGMLATYGPATPYDLKRWVDASVSYFWSVPRAQLYVEPERLAKRGLVTEDREESGRRRRVYRITEAGREALREWLRASDPETVQLRDPGLLKLLFAGAVSRDEIVELAREQEAAHARRLATYEGIEAGLAGDVRQAFALATLRMGLLHERAAVQFWKAIAAQPPVGAGVEAGDP